MVKAGEICKAAGEVAYREMWRSSRLRPGASAFVGGSEQSFMKIPYFSVT